MSVLLPLVLLLLLLLLMHAGTPRGDQLHFVDSKEGLKELSKLQMYSRRNFAELFDPVQYKIAKPNPLALDLLEKMLKFSPDERISVEDALCHPYLKVHYKQRHCTPWAVLSLPLTCTCTPPTHSLTHRTSTGRWLSPAATACSTSTSKSASPATTRCLRRRY